MKAHRVRNVILSAAELDEGKGCGGKKYEVAFAYRTSWFRPPLYTFNAPAGHRDFLSMACEGYTRKKEEGWGTGKDGGGSGVWSWPLRIDRAAVPDAQGR